MSKQKATDLKSKQDELKEKKEQQIDKEFLDRYKALSQELRRDLRPILVPQRSEIKASVEIVRIIPDKKPTLE